VVAMIVWTFGPKVVGKLFRLHKLLHIQDGFRPRIRSLLTIN
jgi:hypothetical protein